MPKLLALEEDTLNMLKDVIKRALDDVYLYADNLELYVAERILDSIGTMILAMKSFLSYLRQRYSIAKPRENEEKEDE